MTVIAATAWGGIALFLVPLPVATILLILGARRERADTLLLMGVAITLLPAVWATALRAEWGGCNGCLSGSDKDWMILALPSVPLLAAAAFLLFTGRAEVAAIVAVVAQVLLGVGLWRLDKAMSVFLFLLAAGEVAYVLLKRAAARDVETISAGNGHPGGARVLTRE